ncbi:DUF6035 family protein [Pseudorhodoplanes sinuspersici]|uniref:Uncharacterized protein n=1 Tax=Pseudorhodoplanes sinuspersici TaxID=1235591 RepID=A0A1W6ZL76_9HYPH|nr:DUF6035 family protein [Pseudorhodoplanes sinuspersici]ARP98109.1 hypothetical protein CAK95_02680 [Pseudorhodoplanes sinuspersici]RKE68139.1 hypothetical protein DFP91_4503 [Pseudorhodoplanes sinuspersici]
MAADRNTTIDPQAAASPVENPEIVEIIDLVNGLVIDVKTFIASHRYGDFIAKRVRIRESLKTQNPLFACALCCASVYAVASPEKRFFFRHSVEDGSCPAQTRHGLSQSDILARKYHGLRESEAHKKIKRLIERSLAADPSFAPESIQQETRWRASSDPKSWRQPDVQATRGDQRFAFEVQLSTTFLGVVVERRLFYRDEGATLVWILGRFEPDYRRLTVDDLLFSHNSNILVVDNETTKLSEDTSCFHVRCFYRKPVRDGLGIRDQWEEKLIRFSELTIEVPQQRAYYFDYDSEVQHLLERDDAALRDEVFTCWQSVEPHFDGRPESLARWQAVKARLAARGIELPDTPSSDSSFRAMLHGLLSAARGAPVGWQFSTLIEVAHHVAQGYPEHLLSFGYALKLSGHDALVESQDATGKWKRRRERVREQMKAGDLAVRPDERWLPALCFLFPEIGARVKSYLMRENTNAAVE